MATHRRSGLLLLLIAAALSVLVAHFPQAASSQNVNGEVVRGLPCVKRLNQLYCDNGGGFDYPTSAIDTFIDDNKKLMRRMYGSLIQEEVEVVENVQTPASTTFVRTVRNFGGSRFRRSVEEGFLEEFLLEDEVYNDIDANFSSVAVGNDEKAFEKVSLHFGKRGKRQAGFPGVDKKKGNRMDACEARTEVTTPYWATNSNGKVRAIVNNDNFEQAVHQEICTVSRTLRCAGDCQCEQKYKWHRLLAYDPNNDCEGVFMDWFLFPSCCSCRCLRNPLLRNNQG